MLARALIVLLVVLNLGVAAWWMARDEPVPAVATVDPPAGVARLQLLREEAGVARVPPSSFAATRATPPPADASAASASGAPSAVDPGVAAAAVIHCYALGPFPDAATVATARRQLQSRATRLHVREVASDRRRGWRVWLPAQADRATAQALVERIAAAGFADYFIVASGEEANSISLGRYGSEPTARRRQAALQAAGFDDVRAEALGDAPAAATWIDIAGAAPLDEADASAFGAQQVLPIDCDAVPSAPAATR